MENSQREFDATTRSDSSLDSADDNRSKSLSTSSASPEAVSSRRGHLMSELQTTPVSWRNPEERMRSVRRQISMPVDTTNGNTTNEIACQTTYSFPVDFNLAAFFGNPTFLYGVSEADGPILSQNGNVSPATLRRQQLQQYTPMSVDFEDEAEADLVRLANPLDSFSDEEEDDNAAPTNIAELLQKGAGFSRCDPNSTFLVREDEVVDEDEYRRSSWSSEGRFVNSGAPSVGGVPMSPFSDKPIGVKEHFAMMGNSLSPIKPVGECSPKAVGQTPAAMRSSHFEDEDSVVDRSKRTEDVKSPPGSS